MTPNCARGTANRGTLIVVVPALYNPPQVTDHGSLVALTADFDADFIGSIAKLVTMAQVSAPLGGGGGDGGGPEDDVLGGGPITGGAEGEVLVESKSGGGGPGTGRSGPGAGGPLGAEGGGGGKLPFTGFAVMAVAAVGAAVTSAGVAIKRKLRRPT
jgi:hypothetical protein